MRTCSRGVSKSSGPYQSATSSGSVQARKTSSRGASKIRVISTSWAAAAAGVESAIVLFLPAQMRVEPVHAPLPDPLAGLHPLHGVVERLGLHAAGPPLGVAAAGDQPRPLEHLEVPRDGRQAHGEGL